ncbi:hypothetical protein QQ73_16475, partial [Candidatus Endoriftia persephone str. Guaymas]|nr:hypothetical protein [Candidatus Endoriftia persephone str. Guaymas]
MGTTGSRITRAHSYVATSDALIIADYISAVLEGSNSSSAVSSSSGSNSSSSSSSSGSGSGSNSATTTNSSSSDGSDLYAQQCASCHGSDPANGRRNISRGTSASATTREHSFVDEIDAQAIATYISTVLEANNSSSGSSE